MRDVDTLTMLDLDTASDEALVAAVWDGDELALGALLRRYRRVVRARARSYFLAGADRDDVVQEGMIGLYKAIRDYDAGRERSFRGFAELCISRQILTAVKVASRKKHTPLNRSVSLHTPVHDSADGEVGGELIDQVAADVPDPADDVVAASEIGAMEDHFERVLSDLEADVLARHLGGATYAEIAEALGRHVKAVDNALQRIKRKVGDYLDARRMADLHEVQ